MITQNDLAILLTKKIEASLVDLYVESERLATTEDACNFSSRKTPSIFNIRRDILEVLNEYLKVFYFRESESDRMIHDMPPGQYKEFKRHNLKKRASELVEKCLQEEDIFDVSVFENNDKDGYAYFRDTTYSIMVLESGKLARDSSNTNLL